MMQSISVIARSRSWWIFLMLLGISMIGIALYYQHVMSEWPCILCIHVRILFLLLSIIAGIALIGFKIKNILPLMHLLVAATSAVMLNRAWILLATERGWTEGVCSIDLGMPAWLALDKWLPNIFAAWTTCGYTPVIAFGITMAEILLPLSVLLLLSSVVMTSLVLRKQR